MCQMYRAHMSTIGLTVNSWGASAPLLFCRRSIDTSYACARGGRVFARQAVLDLAITILAKHLNVAHNVADCARPRHVSDFGLRVEPCVNFFSALTQVKSLILLGKTRLCVNVSRFFRGGPEKRGWRGSGEGGPQVYPTPFREPLYFKNADTLTQIRIILIF